MEGERKSKLGSLQQLKHSLMSQEHNIETRLQTLDRADLDLSVSSESNISNDGFELSICSDVNSLFMKEVVPRKKPVEIVPIQKKTKNNQKIESTNVSLKEDDCDQQLKADISKLQKQIKIIKTPLLALQKQKVIYNMLISSSEDSDTK
ncbi:Hypothetical_protein [Hexamita inflata]|uniref:Hypothetical_protein n=1 Tax=Hexamita inflata TaxID=28002 RepID=A0AA86UWD8_9EUKA|nr:Hypothetical protein HINF_LOCUS38868 [Hexamita inflata]